MREVVCPVAVKKVKISTLYKDRVKQTDPKAYRPLTLVSAVRKILHFIVDRNRKNSMLIIGA